MTLNQFGHFQLLLRHHHHYSLLHPNPYFSKLFYWKDACEVCLVPVATAVVVVVVVTHRTETCVLKKKKMLFEYFVYDCLQARRIKREEFGNDRDRK
jgi:hypothetical protein